MAVLSKTFKSRKYATHNVSKGSRLREVLYLGEVVGGSICGGLRVYEFTRGAKAGSR